MRVQNVTCTNTELTYLAQKPEIQHDYEQPTASSSH